MIVTVSQLVERGARCAQVKAFEREWPDGMTVTAETLAHARELGLNTDWAVRSIFTVPAIAVYDAAVGQAHEAYHDAVAQASDDAWVAYDAAVDQAWTTYIAAVDQAILKVIADFNL